MISLRRFLILPITRYAFITMALGIIIGNKLNLGIMILRLYHSEGTGWWNHCMIQ